MQTFKRSHPTAAMRRIYFTQVLDSNLQSRQTGATGFTVRVIKPDGTSVAGSGTVGEVDSSNAPGVMYYEFTTGELDTAGNGIVRISKAARETREVPFHVERGYMGTVASGTLTAGAFTTGLTTATANHWKRCLIRFLTGALAGQVSKIAAYAVSGGLVSVESGLEFTAAPANGDVFEIINA